MIAALVSLCVVCRQLKVGRTHFLNLVNNAGSEVDEVTVAFTEYLGLVRGLVEAPPGGESKLRTLTTFKWTNSLLGRTPRYTHKRTHTCTVNAQRFRRNVITGITC